MGFPYPRSAIDKNMPLFLNKQATGQVSQKRPFDPGVKGKIKFLECLLLLRRGP